MTASRAERAAALEVWADGVATADLVIADTDSLRMIAELTMQRSRVDHALVEAVRSARGEQRSWSEIATMLGVSKQAAQQKYAKLIAA